MSSAVEPGTAVIPEGAGAARKVPGAEQASSRVRSRGRISARWVGLAMLVAGLGLVVVSPWIKWVWGGHVVLFGGLGLTLGGMVTVIWGEIRATLGGEKRQGTRRGEG